ncbi:CYFA0S01e11694g1_1 [Cyberlindnera fabianii]|uniref:CYFA0S01e11694g1_1 n=1 Tax=Cyberlindnera fabianii TaxID=36022 RepID=A0A061AS53_CYBFA|nr:Oligo(A)/oligo(T)-binding protein [Cyberlindnera fabianii]CDR37538.1 CYFA0S01e11694g1_1 [Cyberlindnera fabianii]
MAKTLAQGRKPGSGRKPGKGKTLSEGRKPGSGRKKGSVSKTLADGRKVGSGRKKGSTKISLPSDQSESGMSSSNVYPNIASKADMMTHIQEGSTEALLLQAAAANAQYNQMESYNQHTHDPAQDSNQNRIQLPELPRVNNALDSNQFAVQTLDDPENPTIQVRYNDLKQLLLHNRYPSDVSQRFVLSLQDTETDLARDQRSEPRAA